MSRGGPYAPGVRRVLVVLLLAWLPAACSSVGGPATSSVPVIGPPPGNGTAPTTTGAGTTTTEAATSTSPATTTTGDLRLGLTEVAAGFTAPLFVAPFPGDGRLAVVEQDGRIRFVEGSGPGPVLLDVRDLISFGGEQGLLGLAFHPEGDGRLYVDYTNREGDTVVAEYRAGGTEAATPAANPASARILLTVDQPAANHNGGMLAFGPDGHLYIGLGDGGGAGDPYGNGQDTGSLLGSILRIDVDGDPYTIPPDNPFAEGGGAPEVWAKGLRNPWRFSFDGDTLYIGDVGQDDWEEVDVVPLEPGLNFGWPVTEGRHCYRSDQCDPAAFRLPVVEYGHDAGCSITGGYVYRGAALPGLTGAYIYGDYCSGMIRSFRMDAEGAYDLRDWTAMLGAVPGLTSFGVDLQGEIYLTTENGYLYRIDGG